MVKLIMKCFGQATSFNKSLKNDNSNSAYSDTVGAVYTFKSTSIDAQKKNTVTNHSTEVLANHGAVGAGLAAKRVGKKITRRGKKYVTVLRGLRRSRAGAVRL